jgi:hypothetical protein
LTIFIPLHILLRIANKNGIKFTEEDNWLDNKLYVYSSTKKEGEENVLGAINK